MPGLPETIVHNSNASDASRMIEGTPPEAIVAATRPDTPSLWPSCMDRLSQEIPEQQFNTWIRPLSATVAEDGSRVVVAVANRFKLDWIRAQYAARISALLEAVNGTPVVLELVLAPREGPSRTSPAPRMAQDPVLAELPDLAPVEVAISIAVAKCFKACARM